MAQAEKAALSCVLALGFLTGLWGIRWGLPGAARLRAFPEKLYPSAEIAQKLTEHWAKLYKDIRQSHQEMRKEEPVTYVKGREAVAPGWDFPPEPLINSYRSLLTQSANPDEKKSFIILSQMRPWELEFKPLYAHYGGAFIYPLGVFFKISSWIGAVKLVPDLRHYLQYPEDMRRLYLCGRFFILLFHLGSLWVLYDIGRRISGWRTGLCAAVFFALCPSVIIGSHVLKPHAYSSFWALAGVREMLLAYEFGKKRDYIFCGLSSGIAAGSAFSLAAFLGLPALAWLGRCDDWSVSKGEMLRASGGLAAAVAVVLASNPYLFFSYGHFAWEMEVFAAPSFNLTLQGFGALLGNFAVSMGPALAILAAAGSLAALGRREWRRLLALVLWGVFAVLWAWFWRFAPDPGYTRFYYPVMALACVLGADALWSGSWPKIFKVFITALILMDSGLRSFVYLRNMVLDSGVQSTRMQAASWIDANIPPGSSVGLVRYPEPAHTPPFRYDRYRLVFFNSAEVLGDEYPDYLVVDAEGQGPIDNLAKNKYDRTRSFLPMGIGWARVTDKSSFINADIYIYKLR
ncbi:MAG: hypothetical protein A3J74_02880 [Elusimicrobia bacterium RIFCSPHIGHO2_02_FULL_57_9]|nr:MAG: hypothetical protein A3J74_02880 [Elusimicrobia bacterium RIFCSPHIGHO2_02_FULL_57_9]